MADLDAGVASYEKLGLECTQRMSNEDLGIHQAILPLADGGFIELVSPISDDSPVGKALARDGEGMHTIAFRATPMDEACEVIKASGATLIGEGGPQVFVRACRPLPALCSDAASHPSAGAGRCLRSGSAAAAAPFFCRI